MNYYFDKFTRVVLLSYGIVYVFVILTGSISGRGGN
jgi:hypothetical protein